MPGIHWRGLFNSSGIVNPLKKGLDIRYSLAHAIVKPGHKSRMHRLRSAEVYYILQGDGVTNIDNEISKVGSNQAIYIPPNSVQCIENKGEDDLVFICIVDPAWRSEDEKIL